MRTYWQQALPAGAVERDNFQAVEIEIGDFAGVFADRYGNGDDASAVLNLVWEATIAKGEPLPADDVAELRWFPRDALPPDGELAFNWLAPCLRAWAAKPPR